MEYIRHIEKIISSQIARNEELKKKASLQLDFKNMDKITIGLIDGDGIGPIIMDSALKILEFILKDELAKGIIKLKRIKGLTIENRISKGESVPSEVLTEIKSCNVLLKGPTTTPGKGDNMPNIESANVTLRRELDLFANLRPVNIPEKEISWIFYRENTEGEYTLGSQGIDIDNEISMDFKITTDAGSERIARSAFKYASENGNLKVSIITKANIIKKSDGRFLDSCLRVAKEFPNVPYDHWYVDIAAANIINPAVAKDFKVFLMPNLYGDILTDEAAQLQGGVGTAGSANIGYNYAMFEAIHGSAPRMIEDGLGHLANPTSLLRAVEMLLKHIGRQSIANKLNNVLDLSSKELNMTGLLGGNTAEDFTNFILKNYN